MLVLHDDAEREYAYGPAQGLSKTKVGAFTQALYDEAKQDGWFVISISAASCRPVGNCARVPWVRRLLLTICAASLANLVACTTQSSSISLQGKPLSGYVRMTQVQAAYLGSGSAGNGVLRYQGSSYPFSVGGLGVGGIGLSKIEAKGEVYGLERLGDFPGAYVEGRYGFAVGNTSEGDLWLKNANGVIMRLVAKRQGLMLSLGGDAVMIQMNQ